MKSRRRSDFKRLFDALPAEIQKLAIEKYRLFRENPNHPLLCVKRVQKTSGWEYPHLEYRLNREYRATCYVDGDTYVWVFIGSHPDFDRRYR